MPMLVHRSSAAPLSPCDLSIPACAARDRIHLLYVMVPYDVWADGW
jgi:hypothetical protein